MSFSFHVKAKKTPFQKQKKLEEERKKRDDEEAAKLYDEFVKDFGGTDASTSNVFVHGGVIAPGSGAPSAEKTDKVGGKRRYMPAFAPSPDTDAASPDIEPEEEPASTQRGGKVRRIDMLLETMKKEQAERDLRKEQGLLDDPTTAAAGYGDGGGLSGAGDGLDQASTNVFVNNLAPDIDESMLLREFGRFGAIGSVKVMWPRDDDQRRRGRNTGFVAFMRREDAERAKEALDGVFLRDLQLALGWGKAVPLPAVPLTASGGGDTSGQGGGGVVLPTQGGMLNSNTTPSLFPTPTPAAPESSRQRMHDGPAPKARVIGRGPDIEVSVPEDARQRFVIDAMAYYVMRDGCEFEQVVMEKEANNPEFTFLFDVQCEEHAYYRWRLFSLAHGDSLRSWRVDPFLMVEDSNRWVPPPMTVIAAAQKSATERAERREELLLSDISREKLVHVLRTLTVDRHNICEAMVFILDHADCAADVAKALVEALTASETPVPLKIARLFLVSDVLHNTSAAVRNVSRYRARLQEALPDIFESLQETYRSADSRMAQEFLRKHVLKVLRVWRGWYIFSDDYLNGLQATFLRGGTVFLPGGTRSVDTSHAAAVGTSTHNTASSASANIELKACLEKLSDEELELKVKHSGLSRQGGREAQVERLLALDTYLHGGKIVQQQQQQQQHSLQMNLPEMAVAVAKEEESGGKGTNGEGLTGWEEVASPSRV